MDGQTDDGRRAIALANWNELTRKLCCRKDDSTMRPIHGCPENFRDSLTTPTATIPNIFMDFCSDRMNVPTKFELYPFRR